MTFRFQDPLWLLLLGLLAVVGVLAIRRQRRVAVLYSDISILRSLPVTWALRFKRALPWLRLAGLALVIAALARPQYGTEEFRIHTQGIAIQMCIDRSGSMAALDFNIDGQQVNRISVVKRVFREFVLGKGKLPGRPDDLIGLITFGGFVEPRCPLTLDHGALVQVLDSVEIPHPIFNSQGHIINERLWQEDSQTAIGDALALAANRLKDAKAKSKIIILLTDGEQTAGVLPPLEGAKIAKTLGVRVYTIGIGTNGPVFIPDPVAEAYGRRELHQQIFPLDEKTLKEIADATGGKYYSAQDVEKLENVYTDIDRLEKSASEGRLYSEYHELYQSLMFPGLGLILLQIVLAGTRFRSLPQTMFWENPQVLELLWGLPLVGWVLLHAHRKRVAAARAFADPAMVARLMPALGGARPWVKACLLLAGLTALIVAGARPRFGVYTETVTQRGVDLFVLLDVSRSMTAEDVAPNRLERAKSDVRDLLPHLVNDRVGLIVFAGKPVVKLPLTNDQAFFRSVLDEVDTRSAPRGGTLIGDAIRKALETMPRSRNRDQVLVLITDGEDQDSYAEDAAKEAADRGVKIFTVGLGDAREGARIPVRDEAGHLAYLQDEGRERWSKLDEDLLKKIALTTGGAYIPAGTRAYDLGQVYADNLAGLTRSEYSAEKRKRYREQFQWFVCLGVLLLVAEMGMAAYKQPATGREPFSPARQSGKHEIITAELASIVVFVGVLLGIPATASAGSREAAQKVSAGIAAYRSGDYKQAAAAFGEADVALPDDLRISFDRGMALAAQGDIEKAVELLQKAALAPDLDLAIRARYNLGCLAAAKARKRLGEHPEAADEDSRKEALSDLALAVGHFRDCLQLDKEHADARHNLELIRVWLKYMQSLWEQHDRQQQRDEMDLPAYLQKLEEAERTLRAAVQGLAADDDPAAHRVQQREAEGAQRKLAEEIPPLKEKITAALSKAGQAGGSGQQPGGSGQQAAASGQVKEAIEHLQTMADQALQGMETAAERLHTGKPAEAVKSQTEVVEKFNAMYRDVAPYPTLVGRAVGAQQKLVDENEKSASAGKGKPPSPPAPLPTKLRSVPGEGSEAEAAWNQGFVTGYSELLAPLATDGLKQLEAAPAAPPPQSSQGGANVSPEELKKQREGLKQSMQRAVTLGPEIEKLSGEAAKLLDDRKSTEALPKQQRALKLLKEIADPLPKQKPQDQKQNQKKDDQKKSDDKKQQQKQQPKPEQKNEKQKQQEASQQQAEASIRQVQQRQDQRKELEKQLQRYLPRAPVEKDW